MYLFIFVLLFFFIRAGKPSIFTFPGDTEIQGNTHLVTFYFSIEAKKKKKKKQGKRKTEGKYNKIVWFVY